MTYRVDRVDFLRKLESVSAGLAAREVLQQSTCLVFHKKRVWTFNDEIACSCPIPIDVEGAVRAKNFLELLSKLQEDEIDIEKTDEGLLVKGKRKKSNLRMEEEILLPIDAIETPQSWSDLPAEFADAVRNTSTCASTESSQFVLTCIHIHPEYLEACDTFRIIRYSLETGLDSPCLVRAASLKEIVPYDMREVSVSENWIHFRNEVGLVLSCRKYLDDYKDLSGFLKVEGETVTLPGGLDEAVRRSTIFSSENVEGDVIEIDLRPDMVVISGEGPAGWYKEAPLISYSGKPIKFMIAPKLLTEVSKMSPECRVGEGKLCIDTGTFVFVTCTGVDESDGGE